MTLGSAENPDGSASTRWREKARRFGRAWAAAAEEAVQKKIFLRAGALTYSGVLSIVPLLAFAFALLKGMGVQRRLEPVLLERVAAGSQEMVAWILRTIDRVNVSSLGTVGLLFLIVSVVFVLGNIEEAFNEIWGIEEQRPYGRKFADYLSMLLVMPLVLFAAWSVTASLKSVTLIGWLREQPGLGVFLLGCLRLTPYLVLWACFSCLFVFMPNTRVRWKPALISGVCTGTVWQLMQWGFVTFQFGVVRYNAIYGALAQLPLMMIWMFLSWIVVLFGAELTFVLQTGEASRRVPGLRSASLELKQELALAFLRQIEERFETRRVPWSAEALAREHGVAFSLARRLLDELVRWGWLARERESPGPAVLYRPAASLRHIPVSELLEKMEAQSWDAGHSPVLEKSALREAERRLLEQLRLARRKFLEGRTLG